MTAAIELYRALGFVPHRALPLQPLPGAMFMELVLESRETE